jgi:hypothetical protein
MSDTKDTSMSAEDKQALKDQISRIRQNTNVTQIMVSRVVKMPRGGGDVFVSLTGNYGAPEAQEGSLSLEDARIATHLLGLEANILAFQQAGASGIINSAQMDMAIRKTKGNFTQLLMSKDKP